MPRTGSRTLFTALTKDRGRLGAAIGGAGFASGEQMIRRLGLVERTCRPRTSRRSSRAPGGSSARPRSSATGGRTTPRCSSSTPTARPAWAERDGIAGRSLEALAADERDLAAVRAEGDVAIARRSRVEQIKRFHVVAGDWVPGGVELTPTMKLRRRPIAEKYAEAIEGLYRG
jgi:hypothetical protein